MIVDTTEMLKVAIQDKACSSHCLFTIVWPFSKTALRTIFLNAVHSRPDVVCRSTGYKPEGACVECPRLRQQKGTAHCHTCASRASPSLLTTVKSSSSSLPTVYTGAWAVAGEALAGASGKALWPEPADSSPELLVVSRGTRDSETRLVSVHTKSFIHAPKRRTRQAQRTSLDTYRSTSLSPTQSVLDGPKPL